MEDGLNGRPLDLVIPMESNLGPEQAQTQYQLMEVKNVQDLTRMKQLVQVQKHKHATAPKQ